MGIMKQAKTPHIVPTLQRDKASQHSDPPTEDPRFSPSPPPLNWTEPFLWAELCPPKKDTLTLKPPAPYLEMWPLQT